MPEFPSKSHDSSKTGDKFVICVHICRYGNLTPWSNPSTPQGKIYNITVAIILYSCITTSSKSVFNSQDQKE